MPKVDFYLLREVALDAAYAFICKLIDKIYQQERKVYLHTNSTEEAAVLDDLLWVFRDISFIPHDLASVKNSMAPVLVGYSATAPESGDVLLNLTAEIPDFFTNYERIIEIVPDNPSAKEISRKKFRNYREQNCELTTHDLTKN